jgi:hypothetical protein
LVSEIESVGFGSLFTLISVNMAGQFIPARMSKVRVMSNFKKIRFGDDWIEAVKIQRGDQQCIVVVAHQEWATPTDTFNAEGCTGFGSVVVFNTAQGEKEIGTRLFC